MLLLCLSLFVVNVLWKLFETRFICERCSRISIAYIEVASVIEETPVKPTFSSHSFILLHDNHWIQDIYVAGRPREKGYVQPHSKRRSWVITFFPLGDPSSEWPLTTLTKKIFLQTDLRSFERSYFVYIWKNSADGAFAVWLSHLSLWIFISSFLLHPSALHHSLSSIYKMASKMGPVRMWFRSGINKQPTN